MCVTGELRRRELHQLVLSAQATDVGVNKATARLFPVANTPQAILALGEEKLREYIKTIGLYQTKARNVIGLCAALIEQHGGEVPCSREALEALPGVGRKTANVVLNTAFGRKISWRLAPFIRCSCSDHSTVMPRRERARAPRCARRSGGRSSSCRRSAAPGQ